MTDTSKYRAYKAEIQAKIFKLLKEFSDGQLNRDQFHAIYERYNAQMELADKAISGLETPLSGATDKNGTVVIREKYMGKARGMMIIANESRNIIETLGHFDVDFSRLAPILDRFSHALENDTTVERVVKRLSDQEWLLFVGGRYTTIVTFFENEPSRYQTLVIQRMHQEFESANHEFFKSGNIDSSKLVYPFFSFVHRSIQGNQR